MAQLIQLRQRLKAIETIKKITHAMRLISMSAHSRLRAKEEELLNYTNTSLTLFNAARNAAPDWHNPLEKPSDRNAAQLIILIGSQRGLCGSFNTGLFHFFNKAITTLATKKRFNLIIVGKQAVKNIKSSHFYTIENTYDDLSVETIGAIASHITKRIEHQPCSSVTIISNKLKGFFLQRPEVTRIIPMEPVQSKTQNTLDEDYLWMQDPSLLCDHLLYQLIYTQIYSLLFKSLLAEQAARFISMDSATRNANNLLETTQLQYNKLRQTKITKELTELTSSM